MLYLCATPIGNLQDVTLRVLEILRSADLVACEDTRHTRILLDRHGINAHLVSFHDHNEEQRLSSLLPLLREGKDVAVVSDAGMPGISDPGFSLVRACAAEGLPVTVLPGPSAVPTALVLSGLPCDRYAFIGFLARSKSKLVAQVEALDGTGAAVVAFESPRRVRSSVAALGERWPTRQMAVCRELTKLHEEVVRGSAVEVLERLAEAVKGEVALVLAPESAGPKPGAPDLDSAGVQAMTELVEAGVGVRRAASIVSALTGLPRKDMYAVGLRVKG